MAKRILLSSLVFILISWLADCVASKPELSFKARLQSVPKKSGFKMAGYWVWGGSVIKEGATYHLFASRWPKGAPFAEDYRRHSEIVRATSASLVGPYEFQEVVIGERDSSYWDSNMAHNPTIHQIGDTYVLFYIGSDFTTLQPGGVNLYRSVGYATAKAITGPWERCEQPIIDMESNNPAVYVEKDGAVKLMFRDAALRVYLATAPSFAGPYTIRNDNVWPDCRLEDFYLFKHAGQYRCICEDNVGKVSGQVRWGVQLFSENGIDNWQVLQPAVVYDHDILYDDGAVLHCVRRERPQLYIENGAVKGLLTGVYDGAESWCQPVPVDPPY